MNKNKILVTFLSVLILGTRLSQAKKMTGDDLSNMIIEGENRLQVQPVIPAFEANPDIYKEVGPFLFNYNLITAMKPPALEKPPLILPEKLESSKTASPWFDQIFEAPILTLAIKAPEIGKKFEYTFLVKDSNGKNFYSLKKKGDVPDIIKWNGMGQSGKPFQVGFDYTYTFSVVDEAGNPQRSAGKPFRIDSFRYGKSGNQITTFFPEALFEERSSAKLSKDGVQLLIEVKDSLRNRMGRKVEIVTYEDDAKFGLSRSKMLASFLAKSLDLPENLIQVSQLPLAKGDGYRHVDIVAK